MLINIAQGVEEREREGGGGVNCLLVYYDQMQTFLNP